MDKKERCKAKTKKGKPCQAAPTLGGLCFFHANPKLAVKFGRLGGRKNRHASNNYASELPPLNNMKDVQSALAHMIAEVHGGRLHPRIAAGMAPLFNSLMRAMGGAQLEQRLAILEQSLEQLQGTSTGNGNNNMPYAVDEQLDNDANTPEESE